MADGTPRLSRVTGGSTTEDGSRVVIGCDLESGDHIDLDIAVEDAEALIPFLMTLVRTSAEKRAVSDPQYLAKTTRVDVASLPATDASLMQGGSLDDLALVVRQGHYGIGFEFTPAALQRLKADLDAILPHGDPHHHQHGHGHHH